MQSNESTRFDKLIRIASAILVPISIALAGHLFGLQMKYAQIESQERMHEDDWRITKGNLISNFVEDLTSSNVTKRKIAVEAILIALPEDGPRIANQISHNDPNSEVRQAAKNSIDDAISRIIDNMFAPESSTRIEATRSAISGWINNSNFISSLLHKSLENIENEDGIWNSVIYLEKNNPEYISNHIDEINALKSKLESVGGRPRTLTRLNQNVLSKAPASDD